MHIVGEKEGDVGSLGNSWVSTLLAGKLPKMAINAYTLLSK